MGADQPEFTGILYVDRDFAQHDTRKNALERIIPEIRIITAETANDAIAELRKDTKASIIAIILSQTLEKENIQKVLLYLRNTDREDIERFLITIGSEAVSRDFSQQLEEEGTDPGMSIRGIKAPLDIAMAVKQRLVGAELILNVAPITDPESFNPSRTEPMTRPDFTQPPFKQPPQTPPELDEDTTTEIVNPED